MRLKEYGVDQVEVADNGTGISPADYGAVTRKHHTSKLQTFTDLQVGLEKHADSAAGDRRHLKLGY